MVFGAARTKGEVCVDCGLDCYNIEDVCVCKVDAKWKSTMMKTTYWSRYECWASNRSSVRFRLNVEIFVRVLFVCICVICMCIRSWLEEHLYNVPS